MGAFSKERPVGTEDLTMAYNCSRASRFTAFSNMFSKTATITRTHTLKANGNRFSMHVDINNKKLLR